MNSIFGIVTTIVLFLAVGCTQNTRPVKLIFDTDMGNDIDDALALGVIHTLQSRGECELLAVTITKDNRWAAPYVDLVNTFYGRGDIPIGVVRNGKTPDDSTYLREVVQASGDGRPRYPHDLTENSHLPDATALLRQTLAKQPDRSVVIVQVGFSTNLARLLDSGPDEHSPLSGDELAKKKCRLLSMMAGNFGPSPKREYNVFIDVPSAQKVFRDWPTGIVVSGYEIGQAILFPASSVERDFSYVAHHPLKHGYELYRKMPYDRETWDLTSVLYAVRPKARYFDLSPRGEIEVDEKQLTPFTPAPRGKSRYLIASPEQANRVRDELIKLASQPPDAQQ